MKTIAFFNPQDGAGKTSLVYHLAWMYSHLGLRVLAADLDPQAHLTAMFLDEDGLEALWTAGMPGRTVLGPLLSLVEGDGTMAEPHIEDVADIGLLAGDPALSGFEDELSQQWPLCLEGRAQALRAIGAFYRVLATGAQLRDADLVLIDVGPNLGAVNRAALIAADHVAVPLAPDLFSLQGLQTLGPRLREWRTGWAERLTKRPTGLDLPTGRMDPLGYVVLQHATRFDRPLEAYARWMARIPAAYREAVLGHAVVPAGITVDEDPYCLSTLKPYRSLMPLAQEARQPMFFLKPADGAIGGHAKAVQDCYRDYRTLAVEIAKRAGVAVP